MTYLAASWARCMLIAGASAIAITQSVDAAQDQAAADIVKTDVDHQLFEPAFFTDYAPQNALDMVRRLPGFVFDTGSSARGFGGTAGNVLIDGARPTSKSGGLEEALSRIPASQVARIEVQRGSIGAGEAAGQTMVANVVRLKNVSSGTWYVGLRKFGPDRILPSAEGTFSSNILGWDTSLKLVTFFKDERREAVIDRRSQDDTLTNRKTEIRTEKNRDANFSFDAGRDAFGGRLQLNGRFGFDSWYGDTERLGRGTGAADGPVLSRFFDDHNFEEFSGEFGADWSRTYSSGWKWRMIALTTMEDWTATDNIVFEAPLSISNSINDFVAKEKSTETIFRTTFGKNGGNSIRPEFGIEGAFNTLDSSLEINQTDGGGNPLSYLPPDPVRVEELRGEAFTNLVWQASEKLSVDGGIKFEVSRISTSGQTSRAQTFNFLKPSLGLSYKANDRLQLGLKAERSVGQLDFGDFAASADASDDRVIAGNPDLRPDRTDRIEGTLDYQFSARGALSITLFHEWKNDVLERIILPSGGQGRANVGSARRWGFEASASLPLDQVLKGGLLEADVYAKESRFDDPVSGNHRRLHDFVPLEYFINFRHDIPNTDWAWGIDYGSAYNWHGYFVDEFEDFQGSDRWDVFVETTQFLGVKMKLTSFYTFGVQRDRHRYLFADSRGGTFVGTEVSRRERDTGFLLEISGQF